MSSRRTMGDGTSSPRGLSGASSHHDTQQAAIDCAREIVRNEGGGEVVIHDRRGLIRDSDTVAPGRDPYSPRDQR